MTKMLLRERANLETLSNEARPAGLYSHSKQKQTRYADVREHRDGRPPKVTFVHCICRLVAFRSIPKSKLPLLEKLRETYPKNSDVVQVPVIGVLHLNLESHWLILLPRDK